MSRDTVAHKQFKAQQRRHRARINLKGTSERPRLSVNVSNMNVSAQIIDDSKGTTLAYVSSVGQKKEASLTEKAALVGKQIAEKAIKVKIKKVIFDRGSRQYHGRLKSLADSARENGLEL